MIYAACLILCAAGSLFTSNSADSANVFAESNITLSNGVLPMISIIQYPYSNGGKPNYTISQFSLNSKTGRGPDPISLPLDLPDDHKRCEVRTILDVCHSHDNDISIFAIVLAVFQV